MFGWLSLMILGMLYRIVPTHISKFFSARGVRATGGIRQALINPNLQVVVLICLLAGLGISSFAILTENVGVFRFGWGMWLIGILGFLSGLLRLGRELWTVRQNSA
jgi:hypothetical protein